MLASRFVVAKKLYQRNGKAIAGSVDALALTGGESMAGIGLAAVLDSKCC